MSKIQEIILEPSKIYTGSTFKLKIKVQDDYFNRKRIITENNVLITTQSGKIIRTEWGV